MPVNHSTRSLAVRASALSLRILSVLTLPAPLGGLSLQLQLDHTLTPVVEALVEPRLEVEPGPEEFHFAHHGNGL